MPSLTPRPVSSGAMTGAATARADIVDRLREFQHALNGNKFPTVFGRAADEIATLCARVAELEADAGRWNAVKHALHITHVAPATLIHSDWFTRVPGLFVDLDSAVDGYVIYTAMQPIALQQFADLEPRV